MLPTRCKLHMRNSGFALLLALGLMWLLSSRAVAAYSEEATKLYNRGVELHQAGFFDKAIAAYHSALELEPKMEEGYSNLGGIYAAQRSYNKATEAFQKALEINPNRTFTLNGFGTVLYARGKIQEAKEMWKKAFTIDPTFASAYYNYGNAVEGEKDLPQALIYYYKALQANPNMADAWYRMGVIYLKQKHYPQAKFMLEHAAALEPDAEFGRDAVKQIEAINKILEADKSDKQDIKPSVIAPANAQPSKPAATEGDLPEATQYSGKHSGLFKKHKKEKKVDMFIQPSSQTGSSSGSPAGGEDDLKEKPQ